MRSEFCPISTRTSNPQILVNPADESLYIPVILTQINWRRKLLSVTLEFGLEQETSAQTQATGSPHFGYACLLIAPQTIDYAEGVEYQLPTMCSIISFGEQLRWVDAK